MEKKAFTLAETLTTLIVIGVIAAITLPTLQSGIGEKTKESQKKTFNTKLKMGLSNMQIHKALAQDYEKTADFIEAMKKYMNITKSCDAKNLSGCFASKIKESKSSVKYQTSNIKTSTDIEAGFSNPSDLGAVVFSDGTSAIIAYNTGCVITDMFDTSVDTTDCFAMIYDINGNEPPNIIGEDIHTINLEYGGSGITIADVFSPTSYTKEQCLKAKDAGAPIPECGSDNDYWAMAVDKCYNDGHRLPSRKQLKDIAVEMYGGTNVNLEGVTNDLPAASGEYWEKIGAGKYWSSDIYTSYPSSYSYYRSFSSTSTDGSLSGAAAAYGAHRTNSGIKAFCIK